MGSFFIAILLSFIITSLLLRFSYLHISYSTDTLLGPQKTHDNQIPRIGGISIFLSLTFLFLFNNIILDDENFKMGLLIIYCAIPTFIIGLIEDITKKISILYRFLFIIFSSLLAYYIIDVKVIFVDILIIDLFLSHHLFCLFLTLVSITGLTNAYNIIDGINGLASMLAMLTLIVIGYVGFINNDMILYNFSLLMIGAISGFFIWNYPRGLIFMGDNGAYFIGFCISCLSILLVFRNNNISPYFALLVNIYPVFETLFTIFRRVFINKKFILNPDNLHLHSLIYNYKINYLLKKQNKLANNSIISPYLWALSCFAFLPCIFWWNNSYLLILSILNFIVIYLVAYFYFYNKSVSSSKRNALE